LYILAFCGSPRKGGNSDILLQKFLKVISSSLTKKISWEIFYLYDLNFSPCLECGKCEKSGICILKDDFFCLEKKILKADYIIIATPVFFYTHTSRTQAFFERFQVFWVRRYLLNIPHPYKKSPRGILFSVAGTKGKKLFESTIRSFKYVMKSIYGEYYRGLFFRNVDKKGDILKVPDLYKKLEKFARETIIF